MSNANDILFGSGVPSAKLTEGVTVAGRIVAISEPYQEREYDRDNPGGGKPKTFPSGDPIMTFNLDLDTGVRDPQITEDDGIRRVYMDGQRVKKAVRDAVRASGARGLAVGGHLSLTCTHYDTPGDVRSGKNYTCTYTPGAAANDVLMGSAVGQQPQQSPQQPAYAPQAYAPAPVQQPVQQQAPQSAYVPQQPVQQYAPQPAAPAAPAPMPGPDPAQIAAVQGAGLDPRAVFAAQYPAWAATWQG